MMLNLSHRGNDDLLTVSPEPIKDGDAESVSSGSSSFQKPLLSVDEQYMSGKHSFLDDMTTTNLEGSSTTDHSDLQALPTIALSLGGLSISAPKEDTSSSASTTDVSKMLTEVLHNSTSRSGSIVSSSLTDIPPPPSSNDAVTASSVDIDSTISDLISYPDNQSITSTDNCLSSPDLFLGRDKQYFILSTSGKFIYSRYGTDELVSGYAGILQTIVSYFDSTTNGNTPKSYLKSFSAGKTSFVFSLEEPLILVAVDKLGQSEAQLKSQLDFLYAQVLSTLTKSQITKVFETRRNFDLRQLLGGTEVFLNALTEEMCRGSPAILLGALECLKLRKTVRDKINNILIDCRTSNLLYGLIVADGRLVSVIRPRRHSLHPPDLYLLFSMVFNTSSFKDGGEHWVPICLPKFNSTGFLHAYINFFADNTALILISPDKNAFFEVQSARNEIVQQLTKQSLIAPIQDSLRRDRFKPMDIPAPLIRHFLYKSKNYVQFVMPSLQLHYYEPQARYKLMNLYHELHSTVHNRNGGSSKIFYITKQNTTALAWVTPYFEIYCVTGSTTKEAISQSVRAAVSWIRAHEQRLFVIDGASF